MLEQLNGLILELYRLSHSDGHRDYMRQAVKLAALALHCQAAVWVNHAATRNSRQFAGPINYTEYNLSSEGAKELILGWHNENLDWHEFPYDTGNLSTASHRHDTHRFPHALVCSDDCKSSNIKHEFWFFRDQREHGFQMESAMAVQLLMAHMRSSHKISLFNMFRGGSSHVQSIRAITDAQGTIIECDAAFKSVLSHWVVTNRLALNWHQYEYPANILISPGLALNIRRDSQYFYIEAAVDGQFMLSLLTTGETRVFDCLLTLGASNADIANRLSISPSTVNNHLNAIFRKLGVRSRTEIVGRFLNLNSG